MGKDLLATMEEIKSVAKINNKKTRRISTFLIGKVIRQGDVYIHRVANNHPIGEELFIKQIVDGISIGARHILTGDFKIFEGKALPSYVNKIFSIGYAFKVGQEGVTVIHPEHAHFEILSTGLYQVTHQMDFRTLRRVLD